MRIDRFIFVGMNHTIGVSKAMENLLQRKIIFKGVINYQVSSCNVSPLRFELFSLFSKNTVITRAIPEFSYKVNHLAY